MQSGFAKVHCQSRLDTKELCVKAIFATLSQIKENIINICFWICHFSP